MIRASARRGTTVLLCTHDLEEAARLADEVVIVDRGRLISQGTPCELTRSLPERRVYCPTSLNTDQLERLPGFCQVSLDEGTANILVRNTNAFIQALLAADPALEDLSVAWLAAIFAGVRLETGQWLALIGVLVLGTLPFSLLGLALGLWLSPNAAPAVIKPAAGDPVGLVDSGQPAAGNDPGPGGVAAAVSSGWTRPARQRHPCRTLASAYGCPAGLYTVQRRPGHPGLAPLQGSLKPCVNRFSLLLWSWCWPG